MSSCKIIITVFLLLISSVVAAEQEFIWRDPIEGIRAWLQEEHKINSIKNMHIFAVLATADKHGVAKTRMVEVKIVNSKNILFFSHRNSRKFNDLMDNPKATLHFWLPKTHKQVSLEGSVENLPADKLRKHWKKVPKNMQLRFLASDHKSDIDSLAILNERYRDMEEASQEIPLPKEFIGYKFTPKQGIFYAVNPGDFADKFVVSFADGWKVVRQEP